MTLGSSIDLTDAMEADQLRLEWQAIVDANTSKPVALEALVRWHHPDYGVLPPARFLPVSERGSVGVALTSHVLNMALRQQAEWRTEGSDYPISVNVSPDALASMSMVKTVADLLDRYGCQPERLTLEVTERSCRVDVEGPRLSLLALARMGVRTSLDDFGMGESSLSRLQRLHFDELKIDQSFVTNLDRVPTDRCIVQFATRLAHGLGMRVVAEGVERRPVIAYLRSMGVDLLQGFYFHRPCRPEGVGMATFGVRDC
jgi:diguanylate cyclase